MNRIEIADWLNQLGIAWGGVPEGTKLPKTTMPKAEVEANTRGWNAHVEGGYLEQGQRRWQEWQEGDEDFRDMYLWPASIPRVGTAGAVCADLDRVEHADEDAAWLREHVAPNPILDFPKRDDDGKPLGKRHVWIASNVVTGNGRILNDAGEHIGEWRGRTPEGTLGVGMRMYKGEVEALIAALKVGVGHPLTADQFQRTTGPKAEPGGVTGGQPGAWWTGGGRWTVERVVTGLDAMRPGEGLHYNQAFPGPIMSLVGARVMTPDNYEDVALPILEALRRAVARGVNTNRRAAGSEARELRDAFESALRKWQADPRWVAGRGSGIDEEGEPPPDDLGGDFELLERYRARHREGQADRPVTSRRQLHEAEGDVLASIERRILGHEAGEGGDDTAATLDALAKANREGVEVDGKLLVGEAAVEHVIRKRERRGIVESAPAVEHPTEPDPREWMVPGWLPAGRIGMVTGKGESGKSRLTLQLAASLASGRPEWIPAGKDGTAIPTGTCGELINVVVATWEDEAEELARRLHGMSGFTGDGLKAVGDRLHHIDMSGAGPVWAPAEGAGSRHVSNMGELTPAGRWLRRYCEAKEARLLVVDPLASAFACSENDRGLVSAFLSDWDNWGMNLAPDCAVVLVSHPSKDSEGNADYRQSGSTSWHGRSRYTWVMAREKFGEKPADGKEDDRPEKMRLQVAKSNYLTREKPDVCLEESGAGWQVSGTWKAAAGSGRKQGGKGVGSENDGR